MQLRNATCIFNTSRLQSPGRLTSPCLQLAIIDEYSGLAPLFAVCTAALSVADPFRSRSTTWLYLRLQATASVAYFSIRKSTLSRRIQNTKNKRQFCSILFHIIKWFMMFSSIIVLWIDIIVTCTVNNRADDNVPCIIVDLSSQYRKGCESITGDKILIIWSRHQSHYCSLLRSIFFHSYLLKYIIVLESVQLK